MFSAGGFGGTAFGGPSGPAPSRFGQQSLSSIVNHDVHEDSNERTYRERMASGRSASLGSSTFSDVTIIQPPPPATTTSTPSSLDITPSFFTTAQPTNPSIASRSAVPPSSSSSSSPPPSITAAALSLAFTATSPSTQLPSPGSYALPTSFAVLPSSTSQARTGSSKMRAHKPTKRSNPSLAQVGGAAAAEGGGVGGGGVAAFAFTSSSSSPTAAGLDGLTINATSTTAPEGERQAGAIESGEASSFSSFSSKYVSSFAPVSVPVRNQNALERDEKVSNTIYLRSKTASQDSTMLCSLMDERRKLLELLEAHRASSFTSVSLLNALEEDLGVLEAMLKDAKRFCVFPSVSSKQQRAEEAQSTTTPQAQAEAKKAERPGLVNAFSFGGGGAKQAGEEGN